MRYIVELQAECWLATWTGDPGRTCVESSAKRYNTRAKAGKALDAARKWRPFLDAWIVEVPE